MKTKVKGNFPKDHSTTNAMSNSVETVQTVTVTIGTTTTTHAADPRNPIAKRTRSESRHPTPISKRTLSQADVTRKNFSDKTHSTSSEIHRTRQTRNILPTPQHARSNKNRHVKHTHIHKSKALMYPSSTTYRHYRHPSTNVFSCQIQCILGHHFSAKLTPPQLQLGTPLSPIPITQTENVYEQ